jgi:hypothetical protein
MSQLGPPTSASGGMSSRRELLALEAVGAAGAADWVHYSRKVYNLPTFRARCGSWYITRTASCEPVNQQLQRLSELLGRASPRYD